MAEPIRALELHYPMIRFLIKINVYAEHLYSGSLIKTYQNLETLLFAERGKLEN